MQEDHAEEGAHAADATLGADAAHAAAAEHGAGGLPQFDPTWWAGQIFWLIIIFAILYFLFSRVFVPRVGGAIATREDKIAGDIGEARKVKEAADNSAVLAQAEFARARGDAQRTAAEARNAAKAELAAKLAEEDVKLAQTTAKAEAKIAQAREKAMSNVSTIASDTADAIVGHLTGVKATAAELKAGR